MNYVIARLKTKIILLSLLFITEACGAHKRRRRERAPSPETENYFIAAESIEEKAGICALNLDATEILTEFLDQKYETWVQYGCKYNLCAWWGPEDWLVFVHLLADNACIRLALEQTQFYAELDEEERTQVEKLFVQDVRGFMTSAHLEPECCEALKNILDEQYPK